MQQLQQRINFNYELFDYTMTLTKMLQHRFINPRYLGFINLWLHAVIINTTVDYI